MAFGGLPSSLNPDASKGNASGNVLPLYAQCRPRSALGHHEDLGRQARKTAHAQRHRLNGILHQYGAGAADMSHAQDVEMDPLYSDTNDDEETGLTSAERAKMKQERRKRAMLDQRAAGSASGAYTISDADEQTARSEVVRQLVINGVLIGLWYFFSISISVYNKWMFRDEKTPTENDGSSADGSKAATKPPPVFPFPLFTTCVHMIVQFSLAALVMLIFPRFRPRPDSVNPHAPRSRELDEPVDPNKPLMTRWFYITRIAPCGIATSTDIGLGNMSLKFISLTFYSFVLIFAFIFRLEKPTWRLCAIITVMTLGVIMMVAGETAFSLLGFVLVMSAAASSGFRWSLTQILLLRNPATSNPFASIFFLAPVMFATLFIIAVPVEGFGALAKGLAHLAHLNGVPLTICILIFPGCLAFMMTASEFALLQRTSVVTLSICGIFKEVVTISTASIVFEDKLTPVNISGVLVTIACIAVYNYMKIMKMRDEARLSAHLASSAEYQPVPVGEDGPYDATNGHANGKARGSISGRRRSNESLMSNGGGGGHSGYGLPPQSPVQSSSRASPAKRPEDRE